MGEYPTEGAGWRTPFWGDWLAAATSIQSFHIMACQPSPVAVAVGIWYGALHMIGGIVKPRPWMPGLEESGPGGPHGGPTKGRNRQGGKPKARFKQVFNLDAASEFELDNGLKMALFDLGKIALEIGYLIFLADLERDSYLVGTSAAYRYAGCIPSVVGPAHGSVDGYFIAREESGRLPWNIEYDPSHLLGAGVFRIPAGISIGCTYSVSVSPWDADPSHQAGQITTWIKDITGGVDVYGCGTHPAMPQPGASYKVGRSFSLPVSDGDRQYAVEYINHGGFSSITVDIWISDNQSLWGAMNPDP